MCVCVCVCKVGLRGHASRNADSVVWLGQKEFGIRAGRGSRAGAVIQHINASSRETQGRPRPPSRRTRRRCAHLGRATASICFPTPTPSLLIYGRCCGSGGAVSRVRSVEVGEGASFAAAAPLLGSALRSWALERGGGDAAVPHALDQVSSHFSFSIHAHLDCES